MAYIRVIPRDFFNESKLLKCLGQLQLCIHDQKVQGLPLVVDFDHQAFRILQDNTNGNLYCANYRVFLGREELILSIPYNSQENYPLLAEYKGEEYYIFDEKGNFMPNFGFKKGES